MGAIIIYTVSHKNLPLCFRLELWHFLSDFYAFCTNENMDEYSTVYSLNDLMMIITSSNPTPLQQCYLSFETIVARYWIEPVVRNFRRKWSNLFLFLLGNSFISLRAAFFTFPQVSKIQKILSLELSVFNFKK